MVDQDADELLAAARRHALSDDSAPFIREVTVALEDAELADHRGVLYLARAVAAQGHKDADTPAADTAAAWEQLRDHPDRKLAAYAAGCAAAFHQRAGELAVAVEYAVEATLILDTETLDPIGFAQAANALAVVFSQFSAFETGIELAERAFRLNESVRGPLGEVVSYTLAHLASDGWHATPDPPARWTELMAMAAAYVDQHATTEVGRSVIGPSIHFEHALATGDTAALSALIAAETADAHAPPATTPRLASWHHMLRGEALQVLGRNEDALRQLDAAIESPVLETEHDRYQRALTARIKVRSALGDTDGALDDALQIAAQARLWQVQQVGRLASQVHRRAELARLHAQTVAAAAVDSLTGVKTRRELEFYLDELSGSDQVGAVAIFDLDHFKRINDQYGHDIGDQVLAQFGEVLTAAMSRRDGIAARYGGEEFVAVLPNANDKAGMRFARQVRALLATSPIATAATDVEVTVSAGIAVGPMADARALLSRADQALYRAKRSGRDRAELATD